MSENDQPVTPPWPDRVVPGGAPDPVAATAPVAPPPPDAPDQGDPDALLQEERPIVLPPAGPQTGVVTPPLQ
ncbi:MAG: hypothetical protein NVV70_11520 [Cellulomonas sp.]|uniref:Uncharacterized protein n=1 Tax=Cellulomonas gelida TaxID=1712 RepID=A0A4Y3KRA2_9CELL|nr:MULTISPECIES: hypothetical protein [Cellulomonas]MCR6648722.1 hypothetical protein [Cellulomonas sp.]MCR6704681.1 hypothetical protein [Cellulomonas sp.]GEA85904.1 hypothetical protein CGE01nite_31550 [Cellulomonas gelida]GGL38479.1 hypothetical protein GCM10009774_31400 [Cellulomonas gelida]